MNLSKRQPPSTSLLTLCFFFSNNFFFPRKLSDIEQKMVKNQSRANKMSVIADMLWARHDYPLYYFSMKCVIHNLSWKTTCCRLKWFFQWNLIIFKNSCLQINFSHEISLFRTFLTILSNYGYSVWTAARKLYCNKVSCLQSWPVNGNPMVKTTSKLLK